MQKITLVDRWIKLKEFPNPVFIKTYSKSLDMYGIVYNPFKVFRLFGKTITISNPFIERIASISREIVYQQILDSEKTGKRIIDIQGFKIFQVS